MSREDLEEIILSYQNEIKFLSDTEQYLAWCKDRSVTPLHPEDRKARVTRYETLITVYQRQLENLK